MPKPMPMVLPHTQLEVRRMYEERDQRGVRVWSYISIAKALGLSETTVYRIVNALGAYTAADRYKPAAEMKKDAAASLQRLLAVQAEVDQNKGETNVQQAKQRPEGCPRDLEANERYDPISGNIIKLPY